MKYLKVFLALAVLTAALATPAMAQEAPAVSARSALVMRADTGASLWEKNADDPMLIASTTKIMTALVVLEHCGLDMPVVIDPAWTGIEGSSMYLKAGQELTVRELLYGLMLASGNDAAVALACVTAGSVEAFAELMNEKAAELGCRNTHFANPNGLDAEGHYASARDLAVITRAAIGYEAFREIVSAQSKTVGDMTYENHNRLLKECDGVFGVKTGYTEAAGRTLVTCCEREGLTLICVTLSDPDDWRDHAQLYDWAYAEYGKTELIPAGSTWAVPVVGGVAEEAIVAPEKALAVFSSQADTVTVALRLPGFVYAAVEAGDQAGQATAYINGQAVDTVRLLFQQSVAKQEAEEPGLWQRLQMIFGLGRGRIYTLS